MDVEFVAQGPGINSGARMLIRISRILKKNLLLHDILHRVKL